MEQSESTPEIPVTQESVPHIRIVPHIVDVRNCLYFDVIDRDVPESLVLKVGRFTEKFSQQQTRVAFKSKVVSRSHAEIWTENGEFFLRDTKSSSGTFLNHMRLAPPGVESRPYALKDGDILQLGVDYQGGNIDIYKCVKIRLEINRKWQYTKQNPFREQIMKNITNSYYAVDSSKKDESECCICLYSMMAFQALFVAPCSHCFHFKCIKPLIFTSTGFNCPLCRTYADLEASVQIDDNELEEIRAEMRSVIPAIRSAIEPTPQDEGNLESRSASGIVFDQTRDVNERQIVDVLGSESRLIEENRAIDEVQMVSTNVVANEATNFTDDATPGPLTRTQTGVSEILQTSSNQVNDAEVDVNMQDESEHIISEPGQMEDANRVDLNITPVQSIPLTSDPNMSHNSTPIEVDNNESFPQN
ncbi:putative E3 ubiquitin-protein ligase dma1 [Smittium culicis]|uniref:Putative E3 ubiquitin-protein ligase dma1 n=1 Tax=Smittium culicis TaxID=133412 RepID=A0A1R1YGV4_9FUNG|nr:putative E3 ubiquitin-protein ligase dma1 [Smittium culicis]